ncbi:hypothetical protein MBLNU459_g7473t1 [Dothideomycetes sp. NU459]
MHRVQRKFGTLLKRSADDTDVSIILQEFDATDKTLGRLAQAGKFWANAWSEILVTQSAAADSFYTLYQPIVIEEDDAGKPSRPTPKRYIDKADGLRSAYGDFRADLMREVNMIDAKLDYQAADENIKRVLPPLVNAVLSLIPFLLATQIELQYTLVAQLYTTLHSYCQQHGLPSPAPPMDSVVSAFEAEFSPLRHEVESGINMIAKGKAVNQPMTVVDKKQGSVTGLGLRNAFAQRRASSQSSVSKPIGSSQAMNDSAVVEGEAEEEEAPPMKPPRPGSNTLSPTGKGRIPTGRAVVGMPSPIGSPNANGGSAASTPYLTPVGSSYGASRASPGADYFTHERKPSTSSVGSSIAAKKKPPPPIPAKRLPSVQSQFVTALYAFVGQNDGDLSFDEGDRIKVLKKTDSTDDWWEGEIRGVAGSFPANYVKVG